MELFLVFMQVLEAASLIDLKENLLEHMDKIVSNAHVQNQRPGSYTLTPQTLIIDTVNDAVHYAYQLNDLRKVCGYLSLKVKFDFTCYTFV